MRQKIIQYLQQIKCEWFPVEWDPYFAEWLATEIECLDIQSIKIRYSFEGKACNVQYVRDMDGENIKFTHFSHYGTVDRCKHLLLNAVRSVDELKRGAKRKSLYEYRVNTQLDLLRVLRIKKNTGEFRLIWINGEFK